MNKPKNKHTDFMTKYLILGMLFLGFSIGVFAQETVEVTGIVTDANNEPLPGVSVYVVDVPGLGTITDGDGNYRIKMPAYKELTFSYIGFEKVNVLIPPIKDDPNINKATPKLAPELIPSTNGPANGFLNNVCINNPLIDNPEPTKTAVIAFGIL